MTRRRSRISDERDPTQAAQEDRHESRAMTDAANEHFVESFEYVDDQQVKALEQKLESAIVRIGEKRWKFGRFELTPTEIIIPTGLDEIEVRELGQALSSIDSSINFWLGDWTNTWIGDEDNNQKRGEMYDYLANEFGFASKTLRNVSSVCRNIPSSLRRDDVSFTIHRLVAEVNESLKGDEAILLHWAAENNATTRDMKSYIQSLLGDKDEIGGENYLFSRERKPKINSGLETAWTKAVKNGDEKSKTIVLGTITKFRKWLDELEDSLE